MAIRHLTAIIEREGDGYVSLCPELDIASQGETVDRARENLREALELFFETASPTEIQGRLHEEVYVTHMDIAAGSVATAFRPGSMPDFVETWLLAGQAKGKSCHYAEAWPFNSDCAPMHKELKTGTLQSIIRQSGVPKSEFKSP